MEAHTILFDLDGTLTDPGEGITKSVAYALASFGITVQDRRTLYPFIGPPLVESFMGFYGFTAEQAKQAVEKYREYFSQQGIFENTPYPGIHQALAQLKGQGKRLLLATSKPTVFARQILERFDLLPYFDFVGGSDLEGKRGQKEQVIAYTMEQAGVQRAGAWMVGDRKHDVLGARENGLPCAGVLYGYGSREELEEAGAAALLETVPMCAQFFGGRMTGDAR